jgi:hypothetical protein
MTFFWNRTAYSLVDGANILEERTVFTFSSGDSSKMLVNVYQIAHHNIPKDHNLDNQFCNPQISKELNFLHFEQIFLLLLFFYYASILICHQQMAIICFSVKHWSGKLRWFKVFQMFCRAIQQFHFIIFNLPIYFTFQ